MSVLPLLDLAHGGGPEMGGYFVVLVLITACSSAASSPGSLADWGAGRWSCGLLLKLPNGPDARLHFHAVVSVGIRFAWSREAGVAGGQAAGVNDR